MVSGGTFNMWCGVVLLVGWLSFWGGDDWFDL